MKGTDTSGSTTIGMNSYGQRCIPTLDGLWGQLRNLLASKSGVRQLGLPRFVAEFIWCYNHRELLRKEETRRLLNLLLG